MRDNASESIGENKTQEVAKPKQVTTFSEALLATAKAKLQEAAWVKAEEGSRIFSEIKMKQELAYIEVNKLDKATKKTELLVDKYEKLLHQSLPLVNIDLKQDEEKAAQINSHALQIVVEIDAIKTMLTASVKKILNFENTLRELDKSYHGMYYDQLVQQFKLVQKKYVAAVARRKKIKNKFESVSLTQLKTQFDFALAAAREAQFLAIDINTQQELPDQLKLSEVVERLENYYKQVEADYAIQQNLIKQFFALKQEAERLYESVTDNNLLTALAVIEKKIKNAFDLSDKISTMRSHVVVRVSMLAEEVKLLQPTFGNARDFTVFQSKYDTLCREVHSRENNEVEILTELSSKQSDLNSRACQKVIEYFKMIVSNENIQHFWYKQVSFLGRLNAYKEGARIKIPDNEGKEEYWPVPHGIYQVRTLLDKQQEEIKNPLQIKRVLEDILAIFKRRLTLPSLMKEKPTDELYQQAITSFLNEQGELWVTRSGFDALKIKLKTPVFEGLQIDLKDPDQE